MHLYLPAVIIAATAVTACSAEEESPAIFPERMIRKKNERPEWYYAGGELGTSFITTSAAFEQPTKSVERGGLLASVQARRAVVSEKNYVSNNSGVRGGLGLVYVSLVVHALPSGLRPWQVAARRTVQHSMILATDICWWCITLDPGLCQLAVCRYAAGLRCGSIQSSA